VLRGQIAREFPDAQPISLRAAMSEYARAAGEKVGRARRAPAPATAVGAPALASELERLLALREQGAITAEEYQAAKRELLAVS
jgi:hypothetical protein